MIIEIHTEQSVQEKVYIFLWRYDLKKKYQNR